MEETGPVFVVGIELVSDEVRSSGSVASPLVSGTESFLERPKRVDENVRSPRPMGIDSQGLILKISELADMF